LSTEGPRVGVARSRRIIYIVMFKDGSNQTIPGTDLLNEEGRVVIKNGDHVVTSYDMADVAGWTEDFEPSVYGQ